MNALLVKLVQIECNTISLKGHTRYTKPSGLYFRNINVFGEFKMKDKYKFEAQHISTNDSF